MVLTDFNINISDFKFQPIAAFSAGKNAFLILARFKQVDNQQDYYTNAEFKVFHLNNDLNYNQIKKIEFHQNNLTENKPSFYICMDIKDKPIFKPDEISIGSVYIPRDEELRIHLDYSDNCSNGPSNSGNWPCNNVKVM
ncbi:hypothetical protein [uncultured Aquimarina sp.]|uniref:hypothetical protein n=1 Tax=uncultured Aquimarina sp. TaxID=575652 RepID=UPI002637D014|nr:hypothetical protein [uncultured Aquimarina sp.]